METGTGALLRTASGSRPVLRQSLTTAQIIGAFSELVPPELKGSFPGQGALKFRYDSPAGAVSVRFDSTRDRPSAVVCLAQAPNDAPAKPQTPPARQPAPAPPPAPEGEGPRPPVAPPPEGASAARARLPPPPPQHP